jgi:hypothetical protein
MCNRRSRTRSMPGPSVIIYAHNYVILVAVVYTSGWGGSTAPGMSGVALRATMAGCVIARPAGMRRRVRSSGSAERQNVCAATLNCALAGRPSLHAGQPGCGQRVTGTERRSTQHLRQETELNVGAGELVTDQKTFAIAVPASFLLQSERSLGNDVSLDFVRASVDRARTLVQVA